MKLFMAESTRRPSEARAFPLVLKPLSALPDDYHVILNIHYPKEIDLLILSQRSIIALEVKAWASAVPLTEDRRPAGDDFFHAPVWKHDKAEDPNANLCENPILTIRKKAGEVSAHIKSLCGLRLPCFPLLVFPNWKRPAGAESWISDGFGRVFFRDDLRFRLLEFFGNHSFESANPVKNPDCRTAELAEALIRTSLIPKGFTQRADWTAPAPAAVPASGLAAPLPDNNFQFSGPVTGSRFVGLKDSLRDLTSRLVSPGHLFLSGMRRTGKTSLVRRAWDLGRAGNPPFNRSAFVFLDFSSDLIPEKSCAVYAYILGRMTSALELTVRIGDNLELAAGDEKLRENAFRMLERPWEAGFEPGIQGSRRIFQDAFLKILAAFRKKRPDWRVVVVLDEFSEVFLRAWRTAQAPVPRRTPPPEATPVSAEDLRVIGALIRDREALKTCSFVVIGKPFMPDLDRRLKSEIFAGLPVVLVSPLDRNDMEALVSRLAAPVCFSSELMGKLWSLTRGYPYYVQLLCDAVVSGLEPGRLKVLGSDLERAIGTVTGDDSKFSFELSDYDLKSSDLEEHPLEHLHSAKLLSSLAKLGEERPAELSPWVQREELFRLCRRVMRMEEKQSRSVLLGLEAAGVIEARSGNNQPEVRIGVPLLVLWMRKKDLFATCSMLAG
ncbi:MAG: NERD domain-containing protein [Elusimicrobia bacterium]|nr:NERD domain-containing protein [Elusimicrobiota bacterium]